LDTPDSRGELSPGRNAPRASAGVGQVATTLADPDTAFAEASAAFEEAIFELPNTQVSEMPSRPDRFAGGRTAPALKRAEEPADSHRMSPSIDNAPGLFGPPALKRQPRSSSVPGISEKTDGSAALAVAPIPESDKSAELRSIESVWLAYVRKVKNDRIHVGALLQHSSPAGWQDGRLSISVPDDFHRRLLTNQEEFLREQLGSFSELRLTELYFAIRADLALEDETDEVVDFDPQEYVNRKCQDNPMIRALFDEFGGELIR
jgi:hypothetical protein